MAEGVVIDPPVGNDPQAPGTRAIPSGCLHVWQKAWSPYDFDTGWMVCLLCRAKVRAERVGPSTYEPEPRNARTGY